MNRKKKASAVAAGVLALSILLGGAYAWVDYSQNATNTFRGISANDVLLHDDFDGENKDVYVENLGDSPIFVRVKFAEYMQVGNQSLLQQRNEEGNGDLPTYGDPNDVTTWRVHAYEYDTDPALVVGGNTRTTFSQPQPQQPDQSEYYTWYMTGAQKAFLSGTTEMDAFGRGGLTQEEFETVPYLHDFFLPGNSVTTHKQDTYEATPIEFLFDYLDPDTGEYVAPRDGARWLLDDDGWAYWSHPLEPGTATNLLLDKVSLTGVKPADNWVYHIDVQLQAASQNELGHWMDDGIGIPVAPADNSKATVTETAFEFVRAYTEEMDPDLRLHHRDAQGRYWLWGELMSGGGAYTEYYHEEINAETGELEIVPSGGAAASGQLVEGANGDFYNRMTDPNNSNQEYYEKVFEKNPTTNVIKAVDPITLWIADPVNGIGGIDDAPYVLTPAP